MSKIIKVTDEVKEKCMQMLSEKLDGMRVPDGNISIGFNIADTKQKAKIIMTPMAYTKMMALVISSGKEVAWNGVAYRVEDPSKNEYVITDVMVYPQTVTSTTVDMDEEEYGKWKTEHIVQDDERFLNIRMQAHSHVNMGTSPSTTDIDHQQKILDMMQDNGFFIFMIWNKRMEITNKIYDLDKNILFENADIDIDVIDVDGDSLKAFLQEANDLVKEEKITSMKWKSNEKKDDKKDFDKDIAKLKDKYKSKKSTTRYSNAYYDDDDDLNAWF